jgi:hypothetical protein
MANEQPRTDADAELDATPVPVPPYEEAPSSTGLVAEDDDGPSDERT